MNLKTKSITRVLLPIGPATKERAAGFLRGFCCARYLLKPAPLMFGASRLLVTEAQQQKDGDVDLKGNT